jgi:hypothetical protein
VFRPTSATVASLVPTRLMGASYPLNPPPIAEDELPLVVGILL